MLNETDCLPSPSHNDDGVEDASPCLPSSTVIKRIPKRSTDKLLGTIFFQVDAQRPNEVSIYYRTPVAKKVATVQLAPQSVAVVGHPAAMTSASTENVKYMVFAQRPSRQDMFGVYMFETLEQLTKKTARITSQSYITVAAKKDQNIGDFMKVLRSDERLVFLKNDVRTKLSVDELFELISMQNADQGSKLSVRLYARESVNDNGGKCPAPNVKSASTDSDEGEETERAGDETEGEETEPAGDETESIVSAGRRVDIKSEDEVERELGPVKRNSSKRSSSSSKGPKSKRRRPSKSPQKSAVEEEEDQQV